MASTMPGPEWVIQIATHLRDKDYKWIRTAQNRSNRYHPRHGSNRIDMDLSVCDALRSLTYEEREHLDVTDELVETAVLRGWRVTVAFLCTYGGKFGLQRNDSRGIMTSAHFFYGLHTANRNEINNQVGVYTDETMAERFSSITVVDLKEIFDCIMLLELCLANAWVMSAEYLAHTVHVKLENNGHTNKFYPIVYRETDKAFYMGMTTCMKLPDTLRNEITSGTTDIRSSSELASIDQRASRLLKVSTDVGYIPKDPASVLVYADIMSCNGTKNLLLQYCKDAGQPCDDEDIRTDTRFIRDAALLTEIDLIELLVQKGYALNTSGEEFSILHDAIAEGDRMGDRDDMWQTIKCLDRCGADWCKRDDLGRLPVHIMASDHDEDMARKVLRLSEAKWLNDPLKFRDKKGRTPLHYAAHFRYAGMFELVLRFGDPPVESIYKEDQMGYTPLHELAKMGGVAELEILRIEYGLNPDVMAIFASSNGGTTLLDAAAAGGQKTTTDYLLYRYQDQVQESTEPRKTQIAALLNKGDRYGQSPLYIACSLARRSRLCAYLDFLVKRGSSVDTIDNNGNTLLHAISFSETRRGIEDQIGTLRSLNGGGVCMPVLKKLVELKPSMLCIANKNGVTPLLAAADTANEFVVASLLVLLSRNLSPLQFERHINVKDHTMHSALHLVLIRHQTESQARTAASYMNIAEMLIGSGADVDKTTMELIQAIREQAGENPAVKRVVRLAIIRRQSMYNGRAYGHLSKLPLEMFERVSKDAVRDDEMMARLAIVDGEESEDGRLDYEEKSDEGSSDEDM
jgi:ankyrin repeat protein